MEWQKPSPRLTRSVAERRGCKKSKSNTRQILLCYCPSRFGVFRPRRAAALAWWHRSFPSPWSSSLTRPAQTNMNTMVTRTWEKPSYETGATLHCTWGKPEQARAMYMGVSESVLSLKNMYGIRTWFELFPFFFLFTSVLSFLHWQNLGEWKNVQI